MLPSRLSGHTPAHCVHDAVRSPSVHAVGCSRTLGLRRWVGDGDGLGGGRWHEEGIGAGNTPPDANYRRQSTWQMSQATYRPNLAYARSERFGVHVVGLVI